MRDKLLSIQRVQVPRREQHLKFYPNFFVVQKFSVDACYISQDVVVCLLLADIPWKLNHLFFNTYV
jgi:hypothetical protein